MGALLAAPIAEAVELTTEDELKQVVDGFTPDSIARLRDAISKAEDVKGGGNCIGTQMNVFIPTPQGEDQVEIKARSGDSVDDFNGKVQASGPSFDLKTCLARVALFKRLADTQAFPFSVENAIPVTFEPGSKIVNQDDEVDFFLIIASGTATVEVNNRTVQTLTVGDFFGETALFRNCRCHASIVAQDNVKAFRITRDQFVTAGFIEKFHAPKRIAVCSDQDVGVEVKSPSTKTPDETSRIKDSLKRNDNLSTWFLLDDLKLDAIADLMWKENVVQGDKLPGQGRLIASFFYVVESGRFEATQQPSCGTWEPSISYAWDYKSCRESSIQLGPGSCFGEMALLYSARIMTANITATVDSVVFMIDRKQFRDILMQAEIARVGADSVSATLLTASIAKLPEHLEVHCTSLGGSPIGDYSFPAEACISELEVAVMSSLRRVAVILTDDGNVLTPTTKMKLKEYSHLTIRLENVSSVPDAADRFGKVHRRNIQHKSIWLGFGGFGYVELVENVETHEYFALKVVDKGYMMACGMHKRAIREKDLQAQCDSPFIIKLCETFVGSSKLYYLIELALGGDLSIAYLKNGLWGKAECVRFHVASVVLAFEYLHSKQIVFRDLKPENVLLNDDGQVKLTDMGLSKVVVGKTFTTCGTPDYFAPELIASSGHMQGVDWWTLGILIFELLAGYPPFESPSPVQIFGKVMRGIDTIRFPNACQGIVESLIKGNCHTYPYYRLPMQTGGSENIKKHQWFRDLNWVALGRQTLSPPYRPVVKSKTDPSNVSAKLDDMPPRLMFCKGGQWDSDFATSD